MQLFIQKLRSIFNQSRKLALGVIGLGVIVIVGLALLLFNNKTDVQKQEQTPAKPTFTNYLKPTSEIKVGQNRYVSTCQLLKIDDVAKIFGGVEDDTYISEQYYDTSVVPMKSYDRDITTNCRYDLGERKVALEAEQSFGELDTSDLQIILYSLGDDTMEEKIKLYERATADTSNSGLKTFVANLKKSVATFGSQRTSTAPENVDTDMLVVPVDRGLFSFNIIEDNVVYKLDYEIEDRPKDEFALSDQEIKENLTKSYEALTLIKQRAADNTLDQSPAPTILGDTENVGNTKVIEPCALLTSQLYQSVVGSPANEEIGRTSVYYNTVKERVAPGDGLPLSPSSSCERNGRAGDTSSVIRFNMRHTRSADVLQAALDMGYKFDGNDKKLQTNADWAGYFNADKPRAEICAFRVGPYSMTVSILHTTSAGLFDSVRQATGTEQQCVQLINSISDSVKQYTK